MHIDMKTSIFLIFSFLFTSFEVYSSSANSTDSICTLNANVKGIGKSRIYFSWLDRDTMRHQLITADHGNFVFSTRLSQPSLVTFSVLKNKTDSLKDMNKDAQHFRRGKHYGVVYKTALLENRTMHWSTSKGLFRDSKIDNAPLNDEYKKLQPLYSKINHNDPEAKIWLRKHPFHLIKLSSTARKEITDIRSRLSRQYEDSLYQYIWDHPSSYVSLYHLNYIKSADTTARRKLYNHLDSNLQKKGNALYFLQNITRVLKSVAIGSKAPEIEQADTSGKMIRLSDIKGRAILIDFWASWCKPCRGENPHVVDTYKKFHKKGLEIIGVSLDASKAAWRDAIEKDGLSWTQVSDLNAWNNKYALLFGVRGIPDNFLLDKDGVIIDTNLRGKQLQKAVRKALAH